MKRRKYVTQEVTLNDGQYTDQYMIVNGEVYDSTQLRGAKKLTGKHNESRVLFYGLDQNGNKWNMIIIGADNIVKSQRWSERHRIDKVYRVETRMYDMLITSRGFATYKQAEKYIKRLKHIAPKFEYSIVKEEVQ